MNFDAKVNNQLRRNDFAIIIALNRHLADLQPVRVTKTGSDYAAGTVLGRATSGADSGLYKPYNDSNSDGSQTARCVLMEDLADETIAASGSGLARGIFAGYLFQDKLTGLDAAAIVDLKATTIIDASGVNILKF